VPLFSDIPCKAFYLLKFALSIFHADPTKGEGYYKAEIIPKRFCISQLMALFRNHIRISGLRLRAPYNIIYIITLTDVKVTTGRRPVVKIIVESLSQHDEKHVVPTPLSVGKG
jgi:hypothetical protein